jgi:hypothetical protein
VRASRIPSLLWEALTSLKLTLTCLAALMVLVVACTLAQVNLGTWGAVDTYIRSFFIWMPLLDSGWSVVVFPGGALVGLVLGLNLLAAQAKRLELSWKKAGLWVVHAGLILLFVGEFATAALQVESRLAIEEGQTLNYVERQRGLELAIVDVTDPAHDDVYGVPESRLVAGDTVAIPGTTLAVNVKRWVVNANLALLPETAAIPVLRGMGARVAVTELPPVARDDEVNQSVAVVEPVAGGKSLGTWLVSNAIGQPETFEHDGRRYQMQLRPGREYLPFSLTLKDFKHDVYTGTDIPKNFSSLVRVSNPSRGEERDVLIYMNQPLRYEGKAFYQASFGKGDTLSVLQVVDNPGWLLPYVSCVLVTVGLLIHFAVSLRRSMRRRASAPALEATS